MTPAEQIAEAILNAAGMPLKHFPSGIQEHILRAAEPYARQPDPLVGELVEALKAARRTMRLAHERMGKFARADIGIHGGACPRYGEQELRVGLQSASTALARWEARHD